MSIHFYIPRWISIRKMYIVSGQKRTHVVIEMSLGFERSLSPEKIKRIIKCPFTYILVTRESLYYNETSFCNVRKKDMHHPRTSMVPSCQIFIISLSLSFSLSLSRLSFLIVLFNYLPLQRVNLKGYYDTHVMTNCLACNLEAEYNLCKINVKDITYRKS